MRQLFILAGVLGFLSVLIWRLLDNLYKNSKGYPINHKRETGIRFILLLTPCICMACVKPWLTVIVSPLLFVAWWSLLFDGAFGMLRQRGFWDLGSNDGADDAWTDRMYRRMGQPEHAIVKIGLVFLTTLTYVLCLYL